VRGLIALYPGDVEAEPIGEGALRFGARCPQTCRQHRAVALVKLSDKPPHSGGSPYAAAGRGGPVGGHSFPYPIKVWLNGHEWAKRQATRAGDRVQRTVQWVWRLCGSRRAAGDL